MPDNKMVGLTNVATDELETLNGVPQVEPLPNAERVKIVHGLDGSGTDTSATDPLPVAAADVVAALVNLQTELAQKLETGGVVALDAATLAALEQVTATISGAVALDAATLAALEQVTATISGAVALDAATLAALETIQVGNLPGSAAAVSYGTGAANQPPVAPADAPGRLMGYAVRETTAAPGAVATVRFRSGTTVAGTPLGSGVSLGANESVREWFGPAGINVPTAVFLERVSGSTEVTVYWAAP